MATRILNTRVNEAQSSGAQGCDTPIVMKNEIDLNIATKNAYGKNFIEISIKPNENGEKEVALMGSRYFEICDSTEDDPSKTHIVKATTRLTFNGSEEPLLQLNYVYLSNKEKGGKSC